MTIYESLRRILPKENIFTDELMAKHTSFKIGGPAEYLVFPKNGEQIKELYNLCAATDIPFHIIGDGSNILVSDRGIKGLVIKTVLLNRIKILPGGRIYAETGVRLGKLADAACDEGLSGLEFASGIPGTVGGAVYMNAGAYGTEIKDVCESVELLSGKKTQVPADEMEFHYRYSALQNNKKILLSAVFILKPGETNTIKNEMINLNKRRKETQPLEFSSAGSVFKRPDGQYAGKLIKDSGLRGYTIGGAQISEKHAGFIINKGGATADDVLFLMAHIQETVEKKYNVRLEPEIRIL